MASCLSMSGFDNARSQSIVVQFACFARRCNLLDLNNTPDIWYDHWHQTWKEFPSRLNGVGFTRKSPFLKDFGSGLRILEGWSGRYGFLALVRIPPDLLFTYTALKARLSAPTLPIESCPLSSRISCLSRPATDLLVDNWGTKKLAIARRTHTHT